MNQTDFLIGRHNLNFKTPFFPEDLPKDWQFEYYANNFNALSLDLTADFSDILEDLTELETDFLLVIKVSDAYYNNVDVFEKLLEKFKPVKNKVILFFQINKLPNENFMQIAQNYPVCFETDLTLNFKLKQKIILGKTLYFSHFPVIFSPETLDITQMRHFLETVAEVNQKAVLIGTDFESKSLQSMVIVSEMLGF
jgi:hypothetical protein